MQTFYRDKHRKPETHAQVIAAHAQTELLKILTEWLPIFDHDEIRFVAIDVSPRRMPMYGELREFMSMLEG